MAETDEYPSTPLFSLLPDFLAIVIKHSRLSEPAAKQLVLNYYAEVRPRRRYLYQPVVTLDAERVADTNLWKPQKLRIPAFAPRYWRDHARVDWAGSTISPDDPRCEMLVRLYTGDAFAILQWARFWEPPVDVPAAPASLPPSSAPSQPQPKSEPKKPVTLKSWVKQALTDHPPRREGQRASEYASDLLKLIPSNQNWTEGGIANELSQLGKAGLLPKSIVRKSRSSKSLMRKSLSSKVSSR
jgi:hypothetical protein